MFVFKGFYESDFVRKFSLLILMVPTLEIRHWMSPVSDTGY
jgi:hypothetical protein